MKATKKITTAGAVTIPKTLRSELGIPVGTAVDINTDGDYIIISKHVPLCHFCGSHEKIITVLGIEICKKCAEKIGRKAVEDNG